jgi:hypothetical protein
MAKRAFLASATWLAVGLSLANAAAQTTADPEATARHCDLVGFEPTFNLHFKELGESDDERYISVKQPCVDTGDRATRHELVCDPLRSGATCRWLDSGFPRWGKDLLEISLNLNHGPGAGSFGIINAWLDDLVAGGWTVVLPSGRTLALSYSEKEYGPLRQGVVAATLTKDGVQVATTEATANVIYDPRRVACASQPGETGMDSGIVEIRYPKDLAHALVVLATDRRWSISQIVAWSQPPGPESVVALLNCEPMHEAERCTGFLDVGPGMELAAIAAINGLDERICATWQAGAAGGLVPVNVVDLPFETFIDPANPNPAGVAARLDGALSSVVFPTGVKLSQMRPAGRGHSFVGTVLGTGSALGVEASSGYWYNLQLAVAVKHQMTHDGIYEELEVGLLDASEIRAPDDLAELPAGLIRSARRIDMYLDAPDPPDTEAEFQDPEYGMTDDGKRFARWELEVATRIAQAFGGQVDGGP